MLTVIKNYSLSDIKASINQLLEKASHSEQVRELAVQVTNHDPIVGIYDWARANIRYTPDPVEKELFISPVKMVRDHYQGKKLSGDCDDSALLVTALYRSIGLKSNVVLLDTAGQGLCHAVSQVYSEKLGRYVMVDASTSEIPIGWEIKYFQKIVV